MVLTFTILIVVLAATLSWLFVDFPRLVDGFQPLVASLSIMLAAILVRMNRGMPTIDWKSIDPQQRKNLTAAIVDLTKSYFLIAVIMGVTIISVVISTIFKTSIIQSCDVVHRMFSSVLTGLVSLSFCRMVYVIWRDYDIVSLQKSLIDEAADKEALANDVAVADRIVLETKSAQLRNVKTEYPGPL